jgi:hypothetical protein
MKRKYWLLSLSLSVAYIIIYFVYLEMLGYAETYSNNKWFPILDFGIIPSYLVLTVIYTIPVILLFRNSYWFFSLWIVAIFNLFASIYWIVVEKSTEYLLVFLVSNDITIAVIVGLLINLLIHFAKQLLNKKE